MSLSRRQVLLGLSAVAVTPALAGCGSDDTATPSTSRTVDARSESGALPVTIPHKFGSTTITAAPERVVCVGLVEQDALLALGVVPVATTTWFGEAPGGVFSWAEAALGDGAVPVRLPGGEDVPFERIARLRPDLIIGQYAGLKKRDYELLSKIAPTVAQPEEYVDYGVPWEVTTTTIGRAVGRPAAAGRLVADVTAKIRAARTANPSLDGAVGLVASVYQGLFVYGPQDPRNRLLGDLGVTFPRELQKVSGIEFGASISAEQISRLDHDLVVWVNSPAVLTKETGGLSDQTTLAEEGRQVFVTEDDGDFYVAHSMLTPLSIPYVLERYVPQLAAAVDGRASTKVPAPVA
jgi:iron complex transport system substrate-binding protein